MGFHSFITCDTKKSIPAMGSTRSTIMVTMTDHKGNRYQENCYQGYGIFGGKDFYELLAEMNGKKTRGEGIDLYFNPKKGTLYPSLSSNPEHKWVNKRTTSCEYQGYFYPEFTID